MDDTGNYYGSPNPSSSRSRVLLAVVAVVLVGAATAATFAFIRSRATPLVPSSGTSGTSANGTTEVADACAGSTDPTGCHDAVTSKNALVSGVPSACQELEGSAKDDCLWGVASKQGDASVCALIGDAAAATRCVDGISRDQAVRAKDESICSSIQDKDRQLTCRELITPTTSLNCASRGKNAQECADLLALEQALASGDKQKCEPLKLRDRCLDQMVVSASVDTDSDGLTDGEEVNVYHTDPKNPDTDGDGFKDGDEVKNGYNPNGPGKLVAPAR